MIPFDYGGHDHLLVLLSDILAQKHAERELHESKSRYRDLVDSTQALMCTHDLDGKLLSVNPWAARVLGCETKDLIGRNIREVLTEEARLAFPRYLRRIRQRGAAEGLMYVKTSSGETRIWEYHNILRTQHAAPPVVQGTAFDITERRQAEDALQESEAGYKALFESAPIGIGLTDSHGNILAFNDVMLEQAGYTRADAMEIRNVASLYADRGQRSEVRALLEQQGFLHKYPVKFKRKDGSTYDALLTLTKLDIRGKPRLQVLVQDISPRRAAEQARQESETLYRDLFNNALEGIFRTTPDGQFLSANPALVHMLGYESETELLALRVEDLYVERERRAQNQERILASGELRDFEIHLRRRDGSILIVLENSRAVRDAQGRIILYEGTLTDITERKRIEEALRASEAELRALFEAVPDLIVVLDKEGRYLKIGPGHEDMLYAPADELLGKRLHDVLSRPKADEFVGHIRQALRTGQPVQFEYAMLVGSQIRWFSGAAAPLTEESVVWVARDITPQKQTEEQVQRRLMELEALYESGLALGQTLDPMEISQKVIEILNNRLDWHHAAVRVKRPDSEEVELLAFSEAPGAAESTEDDHSLARNAITRVGQGMTGWVMRYGRIIRSGDLAADPRYHETFPDMRSGLYAPIGSGDRVLGCISVESPQREAFTEADERLLTTLASQAAAALENARLFEENSPPGRRV